MIKNLLDMFHIGAILFAVCAVCLGKEISNCNEDRNFIQVSNSSADIYFNYVTCKTGDKDSLKPTIIFVGVPETTGSGYFERILVHEKVWNIVNEGELDTRFFDHYDALFIDAPGVGWSYIKKEEYFRSLENNLVTDVSHAINNIVSVPTRSKIVQNQFFLYSESYGTKVLPQIAINLYNRLSANGKDNFQGIFLGSPFVNPISQIQTWPERLHSEGFVDHNGRSKIESFVNNVDAAAKNGSWEFATRLYKLLEKDVHTLTSGLDQCNVGHNLCINDYEGRAAEMKDLRSLVKCQILNYQNLQAELEEYRPNGTTNQWDSQELEAIKWLGGDLIKSGNDDIRKVIDDLGLNVFVIVGQQDLVSGPPATLNWLSSLKWSGTEFFNKAPYPAFTDGTTSIEQAQCINKIGYQKGFGNLLFYNVRGVGHRILSDISDENFARVFDLSIKQDENSENYNLLG